MTPACKLSDRPPQSLQTAVVTRRFAVLMTVRNRREKTLAALRRLAEQTWQEPAQLTAYLVDDGSTDGTPEAIRREFPDVRIIMGDGALFWNGGMRRAFFEACARTFDAYIWLNDDTMLEHDACQRLLACAQEWSLQHGPAIVLGSVKDPATHHRSYGGFVHKQRGLRMELTPVFPNDSVPTRCDTMNGNLVYVPRVIAQALGNLEYRFTHQLGDVDYGLRARKRGFDVLVAPGYFGECQSNPPAGTWRDKNLPFRERWANLMSPKGAPPREWLLFVRRHYGWRWPLYALSPYVQTALSGLLRCLKHP